MIRCMGGGLRGVMCIRRYVLFAESLALQGKEGKGVRGHRDAGVRCETGSSDHRDLHELAGRNELVRDRTGRSGLLD